jgi:ABC-type polysaccharide/polyol phosphate export permease
MIRQLIAHRRIILHRASNDLRRMYTGSSLGLLWNVVNPLALIGMYSLVFSQFMAVRMPSGDGSGYVPYLCSGLLVWLAFNECVQRGTMAFIENASYLKRFNAPLVVYPASLALNATITLGIAWLAFIPVALLMGVSPAWAWLTLPLPILACVWMGFAIGLASGVITVFVRDVEHAVKIFLAVFMWGTPIIYVRDILPAAVQPWVDWHPLTPPLTWIRGAFLHGQWPELSTLAAVGMWSLALSMVAWLVLRRLEHEIRESL